MLNEKKVKKFLKIYALVVISLVTIVMIAAIIITLFQFNNVSKQANEEYYDVGGTKVPSIVKVLKEERRVNLIQTGEINEKPAKIFGYFSDGKVEDDLQSYIDYLVNEEGYKKAADYDIDTPLRTSYLTKYDKAKQKNIEIKVKGNLDRYTIGIKILGDEEKIDLNESWEDNFDGDTLE